MAGIFDDIVTNLSATRGGGVQAAQLSLYGNDSVEPPPTARLLEQNIGKTFYPHNHILAINSMVNYTFYKEETHLMFMSNVASACLVAVGVISNMLTLGVLDSAVFVRTSFRGYLQWVCCYNIVSLVLACLRQHTFLLDFVDKDEEYAESRRSVCLWLLWFLVEIEYSTTASLSLLCWNRIWSQRNIDRADTEVDAMRNPILLNVCILLLGVVPTSRYIKAFKADSIKYNMTKCSFSFLHPYGSPGIQEPLIHNTNALVELFFVASLVVLIVEMILRILRTQTRGMIRISDIVGHFTTPPDISTSDTSQSGASERAVFKSMTRARNRADSFPNKENMFMNDYRTAFMGSPSYEERDKSMTYMTVMYVLIYCIMGVPSRLGPYFFETGRNDFPEMAMFYMLRQAFHAGTLLYLCMGSDIMRETITDLAGQLPAVQYTSSTALFEPDSGFQDAGEITRRKSSRHVQVKSDPEASVAETASTPGHLDRLEMGVRQTDPTPNRAVVMTMRSPSQNRPARQQVSTSTFTSIVEGKSGKKNGVLKLGKQQK